MTIDDEDWLTDDDGDDTQQTLTDEQPSTIRDHPNDNCDPPLVPSIREQPKEQDITTSSVQPSEPTISEQLKETTPTSDPLPEPTLSEEPKHTTPTSDQPLESTIIEQPKENTIVNIPATKPPQKPEPSFATPLVLGKELLKRRRLRAISDSSDEENQPPKTLDTPAASEILAGMNKIDNQLALAQSSEAAQQCSMLWFEETPVGVGTKPRLQEISPEDKDKFQKLVELIFWKDPDCSISTFMGAVKKQEPQFKTFGIDKNFALQNLFYSLKNEATEKQRRKIPILLLSENILKPHLFVNT